MTVTHFRTHAHRTTGVACGALFADEAKATVTWDPADVTCPGCLDALADPSEAYVTEVPLGKHCDFHWMRARTAVPAMFDGRTRMGPWANMCEPCFIVDGVGLGLGIGQRLVTAT